METPCQRVSSLIFTIVTSVWLLGERLRGKDVAGMVLIVLGIWLLV